MDKQLLKYFWSHFKSLNIENQILFVYQNNQWKSFKISYKETAYSGQLNLDAIRKFANSLKGEEVYIVHNHPSMPPNPSNPDYLQYRYIQSILFLYDIKVIDFLIVSHFGYYSFQEAGELIDIPSYKCEISDSVPIQLEKCSLSYYIHQNKESILSVSKNYREFLYNTDEQYGSIKDFSPSFILEKEKRLGFKNIFFRNKTHDKNEIERLKCIDRILDPIEIYWIETNTFIPLKLEGII